MILTCILNNYRFYIPSYTDFSLYYPNLPRIFTSITDTKLNFWYLKLRVKQLLSWSEFHLTCLLLTMIYVSTLHLQKRTWQWFLLFCINKSYKIISEAIYPIFSVAYSHFWRIGHLFFVKYPLKFIICFHFQILLSWDVGKDT